MDTPGVRPFLTENNTTVQSKKQEVLQLFFLRLHKSALFPSYPQEKVALAILEDAVLFHPSKLQRQAAALDAKIICKLLS